RGEPGSQPGQRAQLGTPPYEVIGHETIVISARPPHATSPGPLPVERRRGPRRSDLTDGPPPRQFTERRALVQDHACHRAAVGPPPPAARPAPPANGRELTLVPGSGAAARPPGGRERSCAERAGVLLGELRAELVAAERARAAAPTVVPAWRK